MMVKQQHSHQHWIQEKRKKNFAKISEMDKLAEIF